MKILDCEQYSAEWFKARARIPTASQFGEIMTPDFKFKHAKGNPNEPGDGLKTFIAQKAAEKWTGGPLPGFTSIVTDFGTEREEEAIPWYCLEFDASVRRGLFITTDDGMAGCSPDGIVMGPDGKPAKGLESKSPQPINHFKYLIDGELPKQYAPQVHGSLYVSELTEWDFLSYRRGGPYLLLTIKRDESIMEKIAENLSQFWKHFNAAYAKIEERDA